MSHILRTRRSRRGGLQPGKTNSPGAPSSRQRRSYCFTRIKPLIWVLSAGLFCASCGKVGAPVAPSRLTERTSDLTAIQRGASVFLSWPSPSLIRDESSRFYISRVDIYRLTERRDQEAILDPEDYEESARVIGFIDRPTMEALTSTIGHLQFPDPLNLTNPTQLSNTRLRYGVRYVNKRGQASTFSNTVSIEPATAIAAAPIKLEAEDSQDAITISWSPPATGADGTAPPPLVGYNVYRRSAKRDLGGELLNSEPVTTTSFSDTKFRYQADYVYFVRSLSQGANGLIESTDSELLAHTPVDTFPPSAPDPVSVASANGTISLFWPSSPERDVIGYNIYRADSEDSPDQSWIKVNDQPLTTVTFRDDRVVIDHTYYYRLTAIDRFNNESPPSRKVSETAHP